MQKWRSFAAIVLVCSLLLLLLPACGGGHETSMNAYPDAPSFEQLGNLRYPTVFAKGEGVQLSNGTRRMRTAFGSNRVIATIQLAGSYATGDLDGDGAPDAAAVLVSSPGGAGTYLELQAVLNRPGGLVPAASAYLTELAEVSAVVIEGGEITVTLSRPGGETVERRYRLEGSQLIEIPKQR